MPRASLIAAAVVFVTAIASRAGLLADTSPPGVAEFVRQDMPDGLGKDDVERLCIGCHDLMFTMTTRETEEGWTRVINDMRSKGTDGTEAEFRRVISYLATHMGKRHAGLELTANRTKVAPGEHFALGLRLVPATGWRLKDTGPGPSHQVSWTMPQGLSVSDPLRQSASQPAAFIAFPAVVATSAAAGSALNLTARVTYEVCLETCVTETATASIALPVGPGGEPRHEQEFARAGVDTARAR